MFILRYTYTHNTRGPQTWVKTKADHFEPEEARTVNADDDKRLKDMNTRCRRFSLMRWLPEDGR